MKWASAVSEAGAFEDALDAVWEELDAVGPPSSWDLLFVFVSPHHAAFFESIPVSVLQHAPRAQLIGCTAGGVLSGGHELEQVPALVVVAAQLPGVDVGVFHVEPSAPLDDEGAWAVRTGLSSEEAGVFVVLPEPFSSDGARLVAALDDAYPQCVTMGGLASGAFEWGGHALFMNEEIHRTGAVGVSLRGQIAVDMVVAQGCSALGEPMFATSVSGNVIHAIDGRPATDVLKSLFENASKAEQSAMQDGVFLGVTMTQGQAEYGSGDFLIRNLIEMDPEAKSLTLGGQLPEHAIVQFHVRDAQSASAEMDALLGRYAENNERPVGALMFSCLGRGKGLYGEANHDVEAVRRHLGRVPIGGFFGNGELGPVQGTTYLHGYTTVIGFFRAIDDAS